MSPPTEQLIRDYLSRLAVAARRQLGPDDRRALIDRTREFIERKTGFAGPPTALEVGRLLSGLGDPAGLVSQERQRLATLRGEAMEPASRGRLARVLLGDPGKVRGASWHWPPQPGSRADLRLTLIDGSAPAVGDPAATGATTSLEAARPAAAEAAGQPVPRQAPPGDPGSGDAGPNMADPDHADPDHADPDHADPDHADTGRPRWPALAAVTADDGFVQRDAGDEEADHRAQGPDAQPAAPGARRGLAAMTWQLSTAAPRQPSRLRQLLASAGDWSRRHKLEAVAIALLGLGGAIFPPVWLLGAAVALASRLWDYRDKWVALALPVLLMVIGTVAGFAVGSRGSFGHGMHEGWVFAVGFCRATAVLSACYLARRAARGPRPSAVPPWDRPHRVT
jgi:hypothetical protein